MEFVRLPRKDAREEGERSEPKFLAPVASSVRAALCGKLGVNC